MIHDKGQDERRDREAREYYSMNDAEYEARGMPKSFIKNGYGTPMTPREKLEYAKRGLELALTYIPNLEHAAEIGDILRVVDL